MKKALLLLLSFFSLNLAFAQLNMSFVGQVNYSQPLSDVWGYVAPDETEYALVGMLGGTSVVSLADPANPAEVAFVSGPASGWRDIKVWGEFAYVINETSGGLHVLDLSDLPNSVSAEFWAPILPVGGPLGNCHNLWIDEFGVAYISGCGGVNNGGLIYVDVATAPGNPIYLGAAPAVYSHDVYVRNNLAYDAQIGIGVVSVMDVSDKENTVVLGTQATPFNGSHNTWLSDDGNILFTTDEIGDAPVTSYDVSDPSNIIELDQFRPLETLGEGVIPHNVHVWNDFLIISYYTDGCILVDGSRPHNLVEVGNFDTFFPSTSGFAGAWGAYPFLPSGLVLVSDIDNGLYILEPNYVRACYLEGQVTDSQTGAPIFGGKVDILGDIAFGETGLLGQYATGIATAGTYDVEVSKPGYLSKTISVELENGELTLLEVELEPLVSFAFSGTVKDADTGEPVPNAVVKIMNADFTHDLTTNPDGEFTVPSFFTGNYEVIAGKWGYRTAFLSENIFTPDNNSVEMEIETGLEDVFSLDLGWVVSGNAPQGIFEIGNPVEVAVADLGNVVIQPGDDVPEDQGNSCYITGNTSNLQGDIQLTGTTRILSPSIDLSEMGEPRFSFYYWIFSVSVQGNFSLGDDPIIVKVFNGSQTITVAELSYESIFTPPSWIYHEISVADFIEVTDNMQVIFELGDNDPNFIDAAEAGIDFFRAWDADPPSSVSVAFDENISMRISPNPTAAEFSVSYDLSAVPNDAKLLIFNTLGQVIERINLASPEGNVVLGAELEKGMYIVKIENGGVAGRAKRLVKQ